MAEKDIAQRQYHLDYLRGFASISIILLHVVAQDWYSFQTLQYRSCCGIRFLFHTWFLLK